MNEITANMAEKETLNTFFIFFDNLSRFIILLDRSQCFRNKQNKLIVPKKKMSQNNNQRLMAVRFEQNEKNTCNDSKGDRQYQK